jgi:hypothetical protein
VATSTSVSQDSSFISHIKFGRGNFLEIACNQLAECLVTESENLTV